MPASSSRERRKNKRQQFFKQTGVQRKAKRNTQQGKPNFDTRNESDSVARDIGNRKKLHAADLANIQLLNERQREFARLFQDDTPIIFSLGFPGTSKTFLSLYFALAEVFDESSPYEQVVILRSAVESRGLGFLKGTLEEKTCVYTEPYKDTLKELMPAFNNPYELCEALGYLKFETTSFLRGRSIANTIFIIEETQNLDYDEIYTALTRASGTSRVLLTGDVDQDDLKRKREKSGLAKMIEVLKKEAGEDDDTLGFVNYKLEDIVRGGICKFVAVANYNWENSQ